MKAIFKLWLASAASTTFADGCQREIAPGLFEKCESGFLEDSTLGVTEVTWLGPEAKGIFMGSPSITKSPKGSLIATHDYFGNTRTPHGDQQGYTTSVYQSTNDGKTWHFQGKVQPMYWGVVFVHKGQLYMLGVDGDHLPPSNYPNVVISTSSDEGATWSKPSIIVRGSAERPYHCAPTPVVEFNGTLFRGMETFAPAYPPGPGILPGYRAGVVYADANSDLLKESSWTASTPLPFNRSWLPLSWNSSGFAWQEGNAVVSPNGKDIWNILRLDGQHSPESANKALLTELDVTDGSLHFLRWINMPSGSSKFTVRWDPTSKHYYTLSTNLTEQHMSQGSWMARNNLLLASSPNLVDWHICETLLRDDSGFLPQDSARFTGFQYVDWIFDGDDIKYLVRGSYRGANTFHNSNRMLYKSVSGYASKCGHNGPIMFA